MFTVHHNSNYSIITCSLNLITDAIAFNHLFEQNLTLLRVKYQPIHPLTHHISPPLIGGEGKYYSRRRKTANGAEVVTPANDHQRDPYRPMWVDPTLSSRGNSLWLDFAHSYKRDAPTTCSFMVS